MKNLYKINLIIFLTFVSSIVYLFAYSGGYSGRTDSGCSCHGGSSSNTTLSITGDNGFTVDPGTKNGFTVTVSNSSKSKAGVNIAVKNSSSGGDDVGSLSGGSDLKSDDDELVHANNGKSFSSGKATFVFDWTAPTSPGVYFIKAVGNAVDGNSGTSGDQWNFMTTKQVTVKGLILTSLKGGQQICAGSNTNITWDAFGVENVKIELSTNGGSSFDQLIVASTSGSAETYSWSVPSSLKGNNYRIRISDASNSNIKDQSGSNFTVSGSPEITTQPSSVNSCTGENITFSVAATGSNLNYQWYKGTEMLAGKTLASLVINNSKKSDEGDYKCEVSSECGDPVMSNVASLDLIQAPEITDRSSDVTICEGENTTISVTAIGENIQYQWYKENTIIPGATTNSYQISNATSNDGARYKVEITSESCDDLTSPFIRVTVNKPVTITENPKDTILCESSTLQLAVTATGSALQYEWYLDNVKIPGKFEPMLTIEGFNETHVGTYKCIVSNSCGNVNSSEANVGIKYKPVIISNSPNVEATEGSLVKFSIEAEGEDLVYEWYRNEVKISNQSGKDLILNNARKADEGEYICRVINDCDFVDSDIMTLTITDPGPGGILTLSETSIDFGDVEIGKKKDILYDEFFKNIGDDVLQVHSVKIQSSGSVFTLKEIFSFTLEAEETLELLATFRPTEEKVYFDTLVVLQHPEGQPIKVPISGKGIKILKSADVVSLSSEINFGQVELNKTKSETLTLKNNSTDVEAILTNVQLGDEAFELSNELNLPLNIAANSELNIEISYLPTEEKEYTSNITFEFDNSDDITVDLLGSGVIASVANYFESIELYPNPSTNGINIKFNSKEVEQYYISIVDMNGNVVYDFGNVILSEGENNLNWESVDKYGNQISKGYYNLLINNERIRVVEKIIVK